MPSEMTSLDLRSLWPEVLAGNWERDSLTLEAKELEFLRTFPSFDLEDPFHGTCAASSAPDRLPAQSED